MAAGWMLWSFDDEKGALEEAIEERRGGGRRAWGALVRLCGGVRRRGLLLNERHNLVRREIYRHLGYR